MVLKINGRKIENTVDEIGLQNDNGIERLEFAIPRYYGETDLANGICYILLQYPSGELGYSYLQKEVSDDTVTAIWRIDAAATRENGTLHAQLKVSGLDAALWHSEVTRFRVGGSLLVETPAPQPSRLRAKTRIANPDNEQPITVSERQINIPPELQSISVQNDENSETVAIIIPRYFDGHDLGQYTVLMKTISSGGRDDIPLLKTQTTDSELHFSWTLKPPQTSYPGALRLQIRFVGDEFKWETHSASVNIVASLDGNPIIPTSPSILDGFADEMAAYVDRAAQSARAADASAKEAAAAAEGVNNAADAAAANAQAAAQSAAAAAGSEQNAAAAATSATQSAADAAASIEATAQNAAAAGQSAAAADISAKAAAASEDAAAASAASAAQSATAAAKSAEDAAGSATAASDDANAAAASAAAAAQSAADASQSADSIVGSVEASAANAAKAKTEADRAKSEADRAAQISHNLGWYPDPDALRAAYPTGDNGWFAIVGTTDSIWTWDTDTSAWVDTGGGGQGVSDYTLLTNKPQINGVTLLGNKSLADLGIQPAGEYVLPGDLASYQPVGDYPTRTEVQQGYQPKGDYLTAAQAAEHYQPKGNYATADGLAAVQNAVSKMAVIIDAVPVQGGSLTYTGSAQSPSWHNYVSTKMTLGGTTTGTNAGNYDATFTPTQDYRWSDNTTGPKTVRWRIDKAAGSLSLSKTSVALTALNRTDTVTVTRAGDGEIIAASNDPAVAVASVSGSTITITGKTPGTANITISIAESGNYTAPPSKSINVTMSPVLLADCTPAQIKSIAQSGQAANVWSVGDKIGITINGIVGALDIKGTYYAFIIGFNHNANIEGNNTIHFQFGKTSSGTDIAFVDNAYNSTTSSASFIMRSTATNSGGWAASYMKNTICTQFLAAIPAEWQNVIKSCTKYSDNTGGGSNTASYVTATQDKIWLLAEYEAMGVRSYANNAELLYQKQYSYYQNGNLRIKFKHHSSNATCDWWLRSVAASNSTSFRNVGIDNSAWSNPANKSLGFSPGFMVA